MKNFFLTSVNKAMNAYLALDPASSERLAALQGNVITIELLPFHFVFQLICDGTAVNLHLDETQPPVVTIRGTPLQMVGMMLSKDDRQRFFAEDVHIEGNAELGLQVVELFDALQIDWEEPLSALIGDVPTFHTGRFVRSMRTWLRQTERTFAQNVNEYVHEEVNWLPAKEAIADFYNDVDALRMETDRLAAKIMCFNEQLNAETGEETE
jgi:ubiquinone biosynthesis protein UbiJ